MVTVPIPGEPIIPDGTGGFLGEFTGEVGGSILRQGVALPDSRTHNIFVGPSVLAVYKSIGIEGGVQFAAYHNDRTIFPKERYRVAVNLAYFF